METNPNNLNTNLHIDEINTLADIIYKARMRCLEHYIPDEGDDAWSHGCRAREWTKKAIRDAVLSGQYPFLSIPIDRGQSFVVALNGVPVSFFYEDVGSLTKRVTKQSLPEQLSLFSNTDLNNLYNIKWRIIIQKDPSLEVICMFFLGLNQSNEIVCKHDILLQNKVPMLYTISNTIEDAVELEEPSISEKTERRERKYGA